MQEYKTVKKEGSDYFIEKKSKFIGYAKPVSTVDEATEFIATVRSRHYDATHNVYAYVLRDNNIQRYSDDGEPSGTAGVPVLDVLLKSGLVDVCVVATRYFGGTLLGAGGLVRAYSHTSKIAVEAAEIITMSQRSVLSVEVEYSFYDRLLILFENFNVDILSTDFVEKINIVFSVKQDVQEPLEKKLSENSNGKYHLKFLHNEFG